MNKKIYEYIWNNSWFKIKEWRKCKLTWEEYPISEKEFEIKNRVFWDLPYVETNYSPKSRNMFRMMRRNERYLYKRKCDITWKDIISVYSDDYKWKIYNFRDYNSDKRNPLDYSLEVDFSNDLMSQIQDFLFSVPKRSLHIDSSMENSDYCNYWLNSKDCYMCQWPVMSEDCFYAFVPASSKHVVDSYFTLNSENIYFCIWCAKWYKLFYCNNVEESSDMYFCSNCKNCKYCIWCVDLNWKEYCIFNKKFTKEEYISKLEEIFSTHSSLESFKTEFSKFEKNFPKLSFNNTMVENTYCWWNIWTKDVIWFDTVDLQESFYCYSSWLNSNNLVDCNFTGNGNTYIFDMIWSSAWNKSAFCIFIRNLDNCYYMIDCHNCKNCFFCIWLVNHEYCIFNKKYSKEEYFKLLEKIIPILSKEWIWWQFFLAKWSPFPYNDTIANDYYPPKQLIYLDKNNNIAKKEDYNENWEWIIYIIDPDKFISEAIFDLGWEEKINIKWRIKENDIQIPHTIDKIQARDLPEKIEDVGDDILQKVIICEDTKRPFRVIKQELDFYRKYNLPMPRKHPEIRYQERFNKRAKYELYLRNCEVCKEETLTYLENDKIICEDCYKSSVIN